MGGIRDLFVDRVMTEQLLDRIKLSDEKIRAM